tara:strand:+ start:776 stop:1327 length:552 start_codon:yes stop_codon:yes gene_type:complete
MISIHEDSEFHPKNAKKKFEFRLDRDWFDRESDKPSKKTILDDALDLCPDDPHDFDEATWMIIENHDGKSMKHVEEWARSGYVAVQGNEIWVYVPAKAFLEDDEMEQLLNDYKKKIKGHFATFVTAEKALYIETKVLAALFPEYAEILVNAFMGFAHAALIEWVENGIEEEEDDDEFNPPFLS